MDIEGWTFSRHALMRAVEMAVDAEELRGVLLKPTRTVYSRKYKNAWVMSNGRISLCVNPEDKVVITVLWDTFDVESGSLTKFSRGMSEAEMKRIRDDQ